MKAVRIAGRQVPLRQVADRVPTKWFGVIGASMFLLLTAAFGGLREAAPVAVPEIAVGEVHTNAEASIAIERLIVADEVDGLDLPAAGRKYVVLVFTTTNRWDRPLSMETIGLGAGIDSNVSISTQPEGTAPDSSASDRDTASRARLDVEDSHEVARTDDMTSIGGALQPGVPTRLAITWPVETATAKQIAKADEVEVTIYDLSLFTGTYLYADTVWREPTAAVRVAVQPETLGSIAVNDLDVAPSAVSEATGTASATASEGDA